jgi:hypothetical protein
MHCPTCGFDNPLTTRFCAGCGIVLVEDAAAGRGGRLLSRRKSRGATLAAPAIPASPIDLADSCAPEASAPTSGRLVASRSAWAIAAGVAIAVVALYLIYPQDSTPVVVASRTELVPLPVASHAKVPEVDFASTSTVADSPPPPLAEPLPKVPPKRPARIAPPKLDRAAREAVAAEPVVPERLAADIDRLPVQAAVPVVDRWTLVQQEIAHCSERGVLERVFCVQRVRHANCDGYWGQVPSCPGAQVVDYAR